MADPAAAFALFVSCVEGSVVMRYGTGTFIGAERVATPPGLAFHPEIVVAIPHEEYRKYRREYNRALSDGSLAKRTPAQWLEQNAPPKTDKGSASKKQGAGTPPAPNNAQE